MHNFFFGSSGHINKTFRKMIAWLSLRNFIKWKHTSRESNYPVNPNCKHNAWLSKPTFSLPIFWDYNSSRFDLAPSDTFWRWTLLIYTCLLFPGKCEFIKTDCQTGLEFHLSVILSRKHASSVILDRTLPAFDKTWSKQNIISIWHALIWLMLIELISYWSWHN